VMVGLRGLTGEMFREDNALKVRRGLAGRVRDGRSVGGAAYGYRADRPEKGKLIIVEEEAEVVRRIFEKFSEGRSPREIGKRLNFEGIAAPRGKKWNASTINGSTKRGSGIIRNALYDGQIVWN
jgi:site-specific DNA recombinase